MYLQRIEDTLNDGPLDILPGIPQDLFLPVDNPNFHISPRSLLMLRSLSPAIRVERYNEMVFIATPC